MIILAIESSCDESAVAFLEDRKVLSNVIHSQADKHSQFGGVVPGVAAKLHLYNLVVIFKEALQKAAISLFAIDFVAFTKEPGLLICLQIGRVMAETISLFIKKPLLPLNHLLGHAYATLINNEREWIFPTLFFLVSGGHTQLIVFKSHNNWRVVGDTLDDTIGECLDKISSFLGFGYPGGPVIERLAQLGKDNFSLTIPKNDKSLNFSFSGLKTQVINKIKKTNDFKVEDLFCSLQNTILQTMFKKIRNCILQSNYGFNSFVFGGGVMANFFFRSSLNTFLIKEFSFSSFDIFFPEIVYSTDNAAMIGVLAFFNLKYT